jgi:crossover junction endodeoxyribonuclease RuvC
MGRFDKCNPPPVERGAGAISPPDPETRPILGVDPGSIKTGYGAIHRKNSEVEWIRSGLLRPPRGLPLIARLGWLHNAFGGVLDEIQPGIVAMETSFVGRNLKTALILGQARGALITAATARDLTVLEFSPAEVKLAVVGHGAASKAQVQGMIPNLIKDMEHAPVEDEADALGVALCCLHRRIREAWCDLASARKAD